MLSEKKVMKKNKAVYLAVSVMSICLISGCGGSGQTSTDSLTVSNEAVSDEADSYKGYNLSIDEDVKQAAESDCLAQMEKLKDIYISADKGDAQNAVLPEESIQQMMDILEDTGYPVMTDAFSADMLNYGLFENFLGTAEEGKTASLVTYEIHTGGAVGRREFSFDGSDMY
jgi:hypothetical protein